MRGSLGGMTAQENGYLCPLVSLFQTPASIKRRRTSPNNLVRPLPHAARGSIAVCSPVADPLALRQEWNFLG